LSQKTCLFNTPLTLRAIGGVFAVINSINDRKRNLNEGLTEKEKKLIRLLREIDYGEVKIVVQDKQPVRIEEVTKSIKL
jgi:hypothetical protein